MAARGRRSASASSLLDDRRRLARSIVLLAAPAFLLLLTGVLAGTPPRTGEIEHGVRVAGFPVDGANWESAAGTLGKRFDAYLDEPIVLVVDGRSTAVDPAAIGVGFDVEATYERALAVGRGGLFGATVERLEAHTRGVDVAPVVTLDTDALMATLTALGEGEITPPRDAAFVWNDNRLEIRPSTAGTGIDAAAAAETLRAAVIALDHGPLEMPIVPIEPGVPTADLERVRDDAATLLAEPLLVTDGGQYWQITEPALAAMLTADDGALAVNTDALRPLIASLAPSVSREAVPATIVYNGDATFSVAPETLGRTLDVPASVTKVAGDLLDGDRQIALTTIETTPATTAASLQPLLADANRIAAAGMTVWWADGEQSLDPSAFAAAMLLDTASGEIAFDTVAVFALLEPIAHAVNRPSTGYRWIDWTFIAPDGAQPGRLVDINATVNRVIGAALSGETSVQLVVDEQVDPSVLADNIVISDLLGAASTYYGTSGNNRRINIELAASLLDGYLIPPGGEFSFNHAIGGTTTLDDGYQMGYGIIAGNDGVPRTVPSVAGGICQVSTTAFQAAFWAGMPIGERNWHLYWIPNYGNGPGGLKGLDSTVDPDYGLDLTWTNTTNNWIAINAVADGEWITVEVWGTNQGWTVTVDDPVIENVVKADPTPVHQYNPEVPAGQSVVVEHAQDGFTATIHRVVTDASGAVLDDTWFVSYYLPSRNVTLVGDGVLIDEPAPAPVPEPAPEPGPEPTPIEEEPIVEEPTPEPDPTEEPEPEPTPEPEATEEAEPEG